MTTTRELPVLEPGVADRRQMDGGGENAPGVTTELLGRIEQRAESYSDALKLGDESPEALRSGMLYRIATRPDVVLGLVAEIRRLHALAEHYELCGRAYKRIRELNEICDAHPALTDPIGNAAEVELMGLATKLQEYGKQIRSMEVP